MEAPRPCPDCDGKLAQGFIPDATYGQILQSHWYEGEPEKSRVFGLALGLKVDRADMLPITAWRCEGCGRLFFYAHER